MPQTWLISDLHLGHVGITQFKSAEGNPVRPWTNVDEMNEDLINNWNSVVGEKDVVYNLGDLIFGGHEKNAPLLARLKGKHRLIPGNHDEKNKLKSYEKYLDGIYPYYELGGMILSHIPLHESSVRRWGWNVHGHLHGGEIPDGPYTCVSVEHTNYFPITIEEVRKRIEEKRERIGYKPDYKPGEGPS